MAMAQGVEIIDLTSGLGEQGYSFDIDDTAKKKKKKRNLDDDCVILEGDPYKPRKVAKVSGFGSDEVVVLAEKGQIACRDYPHARHLCVTFPFSTNRRDKYCDLCHCYVCDIRAPCKYWGTGSLGDDHCNATDKNEFWKQERIRSKHSKLVRLPTPKHLASHHSQPRTVAVQGERLPAPDRSRPRTVVAPWLRNCDGGGGGRFSSSSNNVRASGSKDYGGRANASHHREDQGRNNAATSRNGISFSQLGTKGTTGAMCTS